MSRLASRAGRHVGFSKTEEATAHRLAAAFSKILGTYIDPYNIQIWPARGYWAHIHQDVQRFTGRFPRPDMPRLWHHFGSWDLTVSDIAKGRRFFIDDNRGVRQRPSDNDFQIEMPATRKIKAEEPCDICDDWGGKDGRPFCPACENRAARQAEEASDAPRQDGEQGVGR